MTGIVLLFPIVGVISPTVNLIIPITLLAKFFVFGGIVGVIRIFFIIIIIVFVALIIGFFCYFRRSFGTIIGYILFFEAEFQLINGARICLKIFRKINGVGFPTAFIAQVGIFKGDGFFGNSSSNSFNIVCIVVIQIIILKKLQHVAFINFNDSDINF